MTASAENAEPGSLVPGFAPLDLALIQLVAERAAGSVGSVRPADLAEPAPGLRAELIDRIARLESLQHTLAALQAATTRAFALAEAAARTAAGEVDPERLERSIGAQVGLAGRVSPTEGRRRVRIARDLHDGLDHVRALFAAGELSPYKVATIVEATAHLDHAGRAEVDRRLALCGIERLGVGKIRDRARCLAAEVAPERFRERVTAARAGARVTLRPAADGMADLIAHLPVEQGVACLAALRRAVVDASVSREPLTRGRGRIMAETLVERLTGQKAAKDVHLDVQVVVPIGALVDPDGPLPAEIPGYGPVPADLLTDTDGTVTWRRLVTRDGIVMGGDLRRRRGFTGLLAHLVRARDRYRCREPYCDAPAAEIDHIRRRADGGPTSFRNGRGSCVFHNRLREQPGWRVERTRDGIRTTTPTGHRYVAPPEKPP